MCRDGLVLVMEAGVMERGEGFNPQQFNEVFSCTQVYQVGVVSSTVRPLTINHGGSGFNHCHYIWWDILRGVNLLGTSLKEGPYFGG